MFLPYLWGIETNVSYGARNRIYMFLPYLWGIETQPWTTEQANQRHRFYPTYEALKLTPDVYKALRSNEGFYPTYEALKPGSASWTTTMMSSFLPYLWGIET